MASEVVDAAKQLVAFTPGQDGVEVSAGAAGKQAGRDFADGLAEYEAGVECLEPVAEVCRLHRDPECAHCDEDIDDLWVHPRDLEAEATEAQDGCGLGRTAEPRWPLRYRLAHRAHCWANRLHRSTGKHRITWWLNYKAGSLWIDWWMAGGRHEYDYRGSK
ncbi:hypothetical protein PJP13_24355 [Mycobacterium kansasii]